MCVCVCVCAVCTKIFQIFYQKFTKNCLIFLVVNYFSFHLVTYYNTRIYHFRKRASRLTFSLH